LELRYDLGDDEKEHHICAKQFAEIHLGRVQEEAVANQHDGSQQEPTAWVLPKTGINFLASE
jgi:hypothetical protein